jgi:hypothetical protein
MINGVLPQQELNKVFKIKNADKKPRTEYNKIHIRNIDKNTYDS